MDYDAAMLNIGHEKQVFVDDHRICLVPLHLLEERVGPGDDVDTSLCGADDAAQSDERGWIQWVYLPGVALLRTVFPTRF